MHERNKHSEIDALKDTWGKTTGTFFFFFFFCFFFFFVCLFLIQFYVPFQDYFS